jgi:hypothetical protein
MRARERRRRDILELWAFQHYIMEAYKWTDGYGGGNCSRGNGDGDGRGDGEMLDKLGERWAVCPKRWLVEEGG